MHAQGTTIRWGRADTIVMQTLTVAVVIVVSWLIGGPVMAISIGSGAAAAVFACDLVARSSGRKPRRADDSTEATPKSGNGHG